MPFEKLPTCAECGDLLPDDGIKRFFCDDCVDTREFDADLAHELDRLETSGLTPADLDPEGEDS